MISVADAWVMEGLEQGKMQGLQQRKMQGLEQGKLEEKLYIAKNMIEKRLDPLFIAEITGLDLTKIQQLSHL